jgi:putative two-component system response regulator
MIAATGSGLEADAARPKVLICDDVPANVHLLEAVFAPHDFEVLSASTGEEALARAFAEAPDVILLDAVMPPPDGFDVCRRLKAHEETRRIPIVIVTAMNQLEDRLRGLEAGSDDFLVKPTRTAEVLARVNALVKVKRLNDQLVNAEQVIMALARAVEARDPYTEGHLERVARYAEALARALGLPAQEQETIRKGAILHDIGKVAVPDALLNKPGPLTPDEMALIKRHPVVGEEICRPFRSIRGLCTIIRHHHERMDGTGYPDGLAGEQIPLEARIVAIADTYDALTTNRPYRAALRPAEASEVVRAAAGGGLDPALAAVFLAVLPEGREAGTPEWASSPVAAKAGAERPAPAAAAGRTPGCSALAREERHAWANRTTDGSCS